MLQTSGESIYTHMTEQQQLLKAKTYHTSLIYFCFQKNHLALARVHSSKTTLNTVFWHGCSMVCNGRCNFYKNITLKICLQAHMSHFSNN